jgi:hypothetical protein
MNNRFDELTKSLAQSVTRRAALKSFGLGLATMALATTRAGAKGSACGCNRDTDCNSSSYCSNGICLPKWCDTSLNPCCCYEKSKLHWTTARPTCDPSWGYCASKCPSGG